MAMNQIGYFGQGAAIRIANFIQNAGQIGIGNTYGTFGQANIAQTIGGIFDIGMAPGQVMLLPEGQWITQCGPYCDLQYFDQASLMWRNLSGADVAPIPISSDGTNFRFANLSGCPVGAIVTNTGTTIGASTPATVYTASGYWQGGTFVAQATPSLVTTPSAGSSTWNTFLGGAVNTTVTITAGGTLYTVAPKIIVVPPSSQGQQPFIPATAVCTISGGIINAVTVTNQGAGYVAAPTLLVINQPGDTTGNGGVLTATTTGAGQLVAVLMATPGAVQTAVPTLAFSGAAAPASAAATVVMNFSLTNTGAGTVTAGSGYTNGYSLFVSGGISAATPIYTNPATEKGLTQPTQPFIYSASTTIVGLNNAASINGFYGSGYQLIPATLNPSGGVGSATPGAIVAPTVGGQNDTCYLYPI